MYDAIVISDIHLGSDICCAKQLVDFLEQIEDKKIQTQKLILNGDVFDSHDFRRLKKNHWKVLSLIRKLSDDIEIIWVAGNHDGPSEIFSHLIGVQVVDEYRLTSGDQSIIFIHGHIYDDFLTAYPILTNIADYIYCLFQKIDKDHNLCRWLKQQSKTYLRCAEQIEHQAIKYAYEENCTTVCCGHTHKSEILTPKDREKKKCKCEGCLNVTYLNTGCWTEKPCKFITVSNGHFELCNFKDEQR